ncbi:helix-turn-helix domain-containing protein [Priestia taiwanensis]|uniref:AraC family transcriptional regulator n=1 Tax=Priestia taiwanensis TaxID=1347902 RepID=A0A917ARM7_9BACI|nr:AraC family transcriptional regulator [Priestia taiwanensis]MBM7363218.1 AraC-like DNA-binding protein [Priestia taiwanensis]GGE68622.1 AraC family transcriptional regulator [Priestia taiwanensis]
MNINQLIDFYTMAPITFVDVITNKFLAKKSEKPLKTTKNVCGLIFPLLGTATFVIDGETYKAKPGHIIHAGPDLDLQVEVTSETAFEYAVIHFTLAEEAVTNFPLYTSHFVIKVGDNIKLAGMLNQLIQHFVIPGGFSFLQSKMLFLTIIEELLLSSKKLIYKEESENIAIIIRYMQQSYHTQLTAIDIANHFGIERRKLTYLFEKQMGMTPNEYLTDLRIQKAGVLLRTSDLTMAEIAERVGYTDYFYFSRVFKKVTSLSPSDFRKHMKEEMSNA